MIAWVFLLLRRQTDNKAIAGHRDLAVVAVVVCVCGTRLLECWARVGWNGDHRTNGRVFGVGVSAFFE